MEAFNLEVEGRSLYSGHSVLGRRGHGLEHGQLNKKELGMGRALEVQTWRQVRGRARAVMCESDRIGRPRYLKAIEELT